MSRDLIPMLLEPTGLIKKVMFVGDFVVGYGLSQAILQYMFRPINSMGSSESLYFVGF